MKQFATYEEENIHYWTNRASGYSTVNQEELASLIDADEPQIYL